LDQATDPADIKDINAKTDAFEQYMHDCGLYGIEDMRPVNELRMRARWKLGKALAKLYRAAGPGREKKMSADKTSFRAFLTELDLDKSLAVGAQRIGALPEPELVKACDT